MDKTSTIALALMTTLWLGGCSEDHDHEDGTLTHADGTVHDDSEHADDTQTPSDDHDHGEEIELAPATIGEMVVEVSQAHGAVEAGKEGHLIVKLPYSDKGETIVRAWIGNEDRTLSMVGKGEYGAAHDDYDIHTIAPSPLPENTMWWIEIEKPDGTKSLGSTRPNFESISPTNTDT